MSDIAQEDARLDVDAKKQAAWQSEKLMNRLVEACKQYPPSLVLPVLAQLTHDFAMYHGASMDGIAQLFAAVHTQRVRMAEADAKKVILTNEKGETNGIA